MSRRVVSATTSSATALKRRHLSSMVVAPQIASASSAGSLDLRCRNSYHVKVDLPIGVVESMKRKIDFHSSEYWYFLLVMVFSFEVGGPICLNTL